MDKDVVAGKCSLKDDEKDELRKEKHAIVAGDMDDEAHTSASTSDTINQDSFDPQLSQSLLDGAEKVQISDLHHEQATKTKKVSNAMLQPIQRSRKRNREKKRREGITAAMKELHDILAKINMDESRRIQIPTMNLQSGESTRTREGNRTEFLAPATSMNTNLMGYHQLGQREIIIDAVNTLSHLHSENERNKAELIQLTASLMALQQGSVVNDTILQPMDTSFVCPSDQASF